MEISVYFWKYCILGIFLLSLPVNGICSGAPFSGNDTYDQLQDLISAIPDDSNYVTEYLSGINETTKTGLNALQFGKMALKAGNASEAERQFSSAISTDPSNKEAWTGLFVSLNLQEKFEELRNQSSKRLNSTPFDKDVWLEKGKTSLRLNTFGEALDEFKQVSRLDPKNIFAHYYSAWAYEAVGENQNAIKEYEKVSILSPEYGGVSGNIGFLLVGDDSYEEALPHLDKALIWYPNWSEARRTKGMVLYHQGKTDDALQTWDDVLSQDPEHMNSYLSKGEALMDMDRCEDALTTLNTGLTFDQNDTQLLIMKGEALLCLERYEEAKNSFENATSVIQTKPENDFRYSRTYALFQTGIANQKLGYESEAKNNYDQALELIAKDVKTYGDSGSMWHLKGMILDNLGQYQNAQVAEKRAEELGYSKFGYL